MKRLPFLLILVTCLLLLTGCDKLKVAEAQAAFNANNYQKVLELLDGVEYDDPVVKEKHNIAKAFVAFDNQDYQTVVDLLTGVEDPNGYYTELLHLSQANLLFADKKYLEVITILSDYEVKDYYDIYTRSTIALIEDAITKSDTQIAANLLEADAATGNDLYEAITAQCDDFSYSSFLYMDSLIAKLPESDFRSRLEVYADDHGKTRTKAFLRGDWKMDYGNGDAAILKVYVNESDENCFGVLTQPSEYMKQFYYEEDDMYWCDFVFEGDLPVAVSHMVRYSDGIDYYTLSTFKIDFDLGQITVHVSGTTPAERIWSRISS